MPRLPHSAHRRDGTATPGGAKSRTIRASDEEWAAWRATAARLGVTVADAVRMAMRDLGGRSLAGVSFTTAAEGEYSIYRNPETGAVRVVGPEGDPSPAVTEIPACSPIVRNPLAADDLAADLAAACISRRTRARAR